ncbi:response regulator [Planktothrix sp. FACHB-1355]|uniref:histidine kinase n=1 Tax=Aerosakkonema funiforme FACHB-1375 TaxID=2949571 RepID=A0A926ZG65_9CYAN|nr:MULTISPECIES: response regulator [Oscillatoriales]MBD2180787.1 response regulator [Aerosakkonema funiforme FACHB-1375]MBD3559960.1 response regulator [Planktothrix sp. FACHB-1355]
MKSQYMNKPKILVVDDEPDNLDLLYRTFYREYKVLRAESGLAALEILASERDIAVIISDQRMPLMSGTEFLSLTATQYPDIIRIILTGYTDVEDLVEAINSGKVFKYVTKPWEAEHLQAVVRQALDTHNVLKTRTQELCRTLRQESLLNTVTNTIRSHTDYRQILQTIVNTVGHMLEADICILRPFQDDRMGDECFVYQRQKTVLPYPSEVREESPKEAQASQIALLAETVWETHDVLVFDDITTDDRIQGDTPAQKQRAIAYSTADIRSSLVVPLICQLELMAVLALHQCGEPRRWQDDEVQLVFMVADQAALALSQARAYDRSLAMAKREALINTITSAIRSSLDPQDIFAAITQQLGQALKVDGCTLSLWTESDEFVQCVGLYDKSLDSSISVGTALTDATFLEKTFSSNSSLQGAIQNTNSQLGSRERAKIPNSSQLPQSVAPIAGNPVLQQLLSTQQPVAINDLEANPDMQGFDLPLRSSARALMVVPLIAEGRIIGSITLREATNSRCWQQADIDLAQAVAAQAAIAVEHARLYQKTRQQAERLQELDKQKTEFFQNISHEFRTPLTLMMGPLESAVDRQQDLPHDQAVIALRNCRRLLRLVNQLLDLQRLDARRMQASFRPCDLVIMVSQIMEAFRPYCEKKGLRLIADLNSCPMVYLDPEKFDKVLYNLLSNAMKFTDSGGSIAVKVERAGDHVRIQVKDTGIGIRTEQIPHLFERFRQAEGSVNRSYEGSGLGLALVKELVELHGGQISVESIYQAGSTFTVWLQTGISHLPLDQVLEVPTQLQPNRAAVELADLELIGTVGENTELKVDSPTENSVQARNRILVVDDNPDLRSYVSRVLQASGFEVLTARDGAEGFGVAKANRPDLIVTDLMMPMVSGLEMIRMIREQQDLKGTPIILLTAKVDEDTRIEGTELGADIYLAKPFNDRELLAAVRNLLELKQNERRVTELNKYLTESVLKRFLPPTMVQKAATGGLSLDLKPEPRLVTILFSDIVGFTQLSNTLRSRRVAELLNEYFEYMTRAVFDNGGTVDKFMGDAVLAMFGAPEELTPNEQVRRAIATARQMRQYLDDLNLRWQDQGIPRVQFRCGIHQGTAVVGMFGSAERADYTAIGPTVNIASRLQQAAAPDCILVSAAVADYLDESEITKGSPLQLKGVDETVLTFIVNPNIKKS